jgi:hypothetical protein
MLRFASLVESFASSQYPDLVEWFISQTEGGLAAKLTG